MSRSTLLTACWKPPDRRTVATSRCPHLPFPLGCPCRPKATRSCVGPAGCACGGVADMSFRSEPYLPVAAPPAQLPRRVADNCCRVARKGAGVGASPTPTPSRRSRCARRAGHVPPQTPADVSFHASGATPVRPPASIRRRRCGTRAPRASDAQSTSYPIPCLGGDLVDADLGVACRPNSTTSSPTLFASCAVSDHGHAIVLDPESAPVAGGTTRPRDPNSAR